MATNKTQNNLFSQTKKFRNAIIAAAFTVELDANMGRFPVDCCHHASKFLGLHLFDLGCFEIPRILEAFLPSVIAVDATDSHSWLVVGSYIVDITADQFSQPPVIVTLNSAWH